MFQYDPFQQQAIQLIDEHKSLLVSAPTGAGKTCIAEYALEQAMARGEHAIYTAPIKALSNQKYRDFRAKYGDKVGILTGDITINNNAPLVIMTTEIYRNKLFESIEQFKNTSWIIFDEIHYLDDIQRGTVWEESIMFSPPHVKFVCLSATIPNIQELADWMNTVHNRNVHVIIESNRPVPLYHKFQAQGKVISTFKRLRTDGYLHTLDWSESLRRDRHRHRHDRHHRRRTDSHLHVQPNRIDTLIKQIEQEQGLPCIYFAFARKRTELLAQELMCFDFLSNTERTEVNRIFDDLCKQYEITEEPSIALLHTLIQKGIAFHHAGMLPTVKEVVERLFTSRLIKLIFTTETFALGINMPAKTVIFDELRKFYGTGFDNLRTRDYYQMAGRAGRRGMDEQGIVYARINPRHISYFAVEKIITGKPEAVISQFNATYATLLNLYQQFKEDLMNIYPLSLHYFQSSKKNRNRAFDALARKLALLKHAGYIAHNALTPKGSFAAYMYGYELPLSEMVEEGLLEKLSEREIAVILAALVFEPRKADDEPKYTGHILHLISGIESITKRIDKLESQFHVFPFTKAPFFHLSPALEAWMRGASFQSLQEYTTTDEGELVRYFRMTIQLLRLIREAPAVSESLKQKAHDAIKLINHDEVDAEKQLRV